jgi:enterochelin esterase-like enzyme
MRRALGLIGAAFAILLLWRLLSPARPDRWAVPSEALGQTRHVLVHPPASGGAGSRGYPLLVLLDGGDQRQHSAEQTLYARSVAVLAAMQKDGMPPTLLVGVENRNRIRDFTPIERPDLYVGGGGALAFIRFLETELVPFVEARWPVGSRRILYGESYGGLLVLDALARGSGVFTDYIAVSPAVGVWPDGLAVALRERMGAPSAVAARAQTAGATRNVFVVHGERDAPLVTEFTPPMVRLLEAGRPPTWRIGVEVLPGEGHNPPASLERGLRFLFADPGGRRAPAHEHLPGAGPH